MNQNTQILSVKHDSNVIPFFCDPFLWSFMFFTSDDDDFAVAQVMLQGGYSGPFCPL